MTEAMRVIAVITNAKWRKKSRATWASGTARCHWHRRAPRQPFDNVDPMPDYENVLTD